MSILKEILYSYRPYIYYVTEGFYAEAGKKNPKIIIWLADKKNNIISITNEKEYKKYLNICFYDFYKYDRNIVPEIVSFVHDEHTAMKIYNILKFSPDNSLKLIIEALDNQPYILKL